MQDGYFTGAPTMFAQTTDGYLWIGTRAGLMRFDGVRFVAWTPPAGKKLPSPFITSLLAGRDGSLWIGTGSGLAHWKNGDLVNINLKAFIQGMYEDQDGTIWVTHTRGASSLGPLCEVREDRARCYGQADGFPSPYAHNVKGDGAGGLWIAGVDWIVHRQATSSRVYKLAERNPEQTFMGIQDLAPVREEDLWVGVAHTGPGFGLQRLTNGVMKPFISQGFDSSRLDVVALKLTRANSLMIGTVGHGLYAIHDGNVDRFQSSDGLTSDSITDIFEDREGDLWVSSSEGIDRFSDRLVSSFSIRQGLSANDVASVFASQDGTLWIGNQEGLDRIYQGRVSSIRAADGFPGESSTSLQEAHPGMLWVGIDFGLWIYENRKFTQITRPDGSALGLVLAMAKDVDGSLWVEVVGAPAKLIHIRGRTIQEEIVLSPAKPVATLAADPGGGVWLVLPDHTLARYQGGKLQTFPLKQGTNPNSVSQVTLDTRGWLLEATSEGVIAWQNGVAKRLTALNGLPCSRVYSLIWDNNNSLWLYAECGLIEISNDQMQKWWDHPDTKVNLRVLDVFDGANPGESPFNPTSARSPDGKLWFANYTILQMVDPARLEQNKIPPPVHIEEIIADRKSYLPRQGLRLPPLLRDLEIDYTALSFVNPKKMLFRYKLEGHDADWQEPGTRRQAFYSDLSPRHYRFRVIASNNDGVWNEAGDALDFTIAPTYYQTAWFQLLCFAAVAGILWLFYFLRLKQATTQIQERLGARLEERERIARELHDTLLQGFQGLMLRFQAVMKTLPAHEPAHQMMEKVLDRADQVLLEGRQSVRDLREEGMSGVELSEALAHCGEELAQDHTSLFSLAVVGKPQSLDPIVFNEAYRIAREVMVNAFRHAQAAKIEVELTYDKDRVCLRIRDDGIGIAPQILSQGRTGHWGLSGMRERAQKIGAQLNLWSHSGAGTEVELQIPARVAYPLHREESLWARIRRATGKPEEV